MRVCRNAHFGFTPRRCVRMAKMHGDEDEGAGSVLKYMTKPESDSNEADWLLWHTASQIFPHPRRYFGFNTSCFWRRNVLYLYRDMGGASAPPFFCHFLFKNGVLGAHPGKIRGRQRKIRGRQSKIWGRQRKIWGKQRKTMRREGKIGRRKVFSEVKNVNVESLKNGSKLLDFFGSLLPLSSPSMLMNGFIKAAFVFWGHELFLLGRHELILFELELFTNCSELTRQLMGINGETFLAGSAPKKN